MTLLQSYAFAIIVGMMILFICKTVCPFPWPVERWFALHWRR